MVSYVIVPGIDGSDDQHWQTFWENEWGDLGVRIAPCSWSEPDLANWVDSVQNAVDEASVRDREVVLVAHSLGCWAVSEWLARNPAARVKAAFLAAPPDSLGSAFPRDAASTFVNVEARTLSCPSIVVASSNDPYCDLHTAARIAGAWGSDVQQVGAVGHINSASGLGSWPLGRGILATLANA